MREKVVKGLPPSRKDDDHPDAREKQKRRRLFPARGDAPRYALYCTYSTVLETQMTRLVEMEESAHREERGVLRRWSRDSGLGSLGVRDAMQRDLMERIVGGAETNDESPARRSVVWWRGEEEE